MNYLDWYYDCYGCYYKHHHKDRERFSSLHVQSCEPLLVPVCLPVRQVGLLSPVVSRAAVSLPVCPPIRQVGPLSRWCLSLQ